MGSFTIFCLDNKGKPVENVLIETTISCNQQCGFLEIGCQSGPPVKSKGYTDQKGKYNLPMPYTVNQTVEILGKKRGYHSVVKTVNVEGQQGFNLNVWGQTTLTLIPKSQQGLTDSGSSLGYSSGSVESDIKNIGQKVENAGLIGSIELTVIIVFISIMIIILGIIYLVVKK